MVGGKSTLKNYAHHLLFILTRRRNGSHLNRHSDGSCFPARGILPAIDVIGDNVIVGIFYFIGFGFFCIESLLSVWVIQQVYMYFRGSGKAAAMKREAARGAMRAAI